MTAVNNADLVILGMSWGEEANSYMDAEAGLAALAAGVPYGFYGDMPNCWSRATGDKPYAPLAERAAFYWAVNQADAEAAKEVFPSAVCIQTGNPLREASAFPLLSRNESRRRFGFAEGSTVVLVPGTKIVAVNMALLNLAVNAFAFPSTGYHIVFSAHPGDRILNAAPDINVYNEVVKFSQAPVSLFVSKEELVTDVVQAAATEELLPGADMVLECSSTIGIMAAYQRIPILTASVELMLHRMCGINGSREFESVKEGVSVSIPFDANTLSQQATKLLMSGDADAMFLRTRQETVYPLPAYLGEALDNMQKAIEEAFSVS